MTTPDERLATFLSAISNRSPSDQLDFVVGKVAIVKSKTPAWVRSQMLTPSDLDDDMDGVVKLARWLCNNI